MNLKKFISPTKYKIFYSILFFIASTIVLSGLFFYSFATLKFVFTKNGFPFNVFGFCPIAFHCPKNSNYISWLNIGLDIIFWYLIACLMIWYKAKRKKF